MTLNQSNVAQTDTKDSIRALFEDFMATFDGIRKSIPYGRHPALWALVGQLKAGISAMPAMEARPQIRLGWSLGAGSWANIPWISLLDERETTSTERGVYIVYLFRQDMSGVYLCLSQGVTDVHKKFGRSSGNEELAIRATGFRKSLPNLSAEGFDLENPPDLHTDAQLGVAYESGTFAHKFYEHGAVPTDSILQADLANLLEAYGTVLLTGAPQEESTASESSSANDRVWIYAPGDNASHWDELYEARLMAIGWMN
jgi:5-methylcytosine-specific restriction protein B